MPESSTMKLYDDTCKNKTCSCTGEDCPHFHVCDDTINCPKYHFCGKKGRIKTAMWKKLAERKAAAEKRKANDDNNNNNNTKSNNRCQNGNCNDICEKSIDEILNFI